MERIEFHPRLVEDAVWLAIRGHPDELLFHRQREPLTHDRRGAGLADFHRWWFHRLGVGRPVEQAVTEQAGGLERVRRFLVVPGPGGTARNDSVYTSPDPGTSAEDSGREGAELCISGAAPFEQHSVVIGLRPLTLMEPDRTLCLLRPELMHISDMLDEGFQYQPQPLDEQVGPAMIRLIQDRYRTLWICSVRGRLVKNGWAGEELRRLSCEEFSRMFSVLGERARDCFDRFFDAERPAYPDLVRMAAEPHARFGVSATQEPPGRQCPLCVLASSEFEANPATLPAAVLRAIAADFQEWRAEDGICRQCSELYRARAARKGAGPCVPARRRRPTPPRPVHYD